VPGWTTSPRVFASSTSTPGDRPIARSAGPYKRKSDRPAMHARHRRPHGLLCPPDGTATPAATVTGQHSACCPESAARRRHRQRLRGQTPDLRKAPVPWSLRPQGRACQLCVSVAAARPDRPHPRMTEGACHAERGLVPGIHTTSAQSRLSSARNDAFCALPPPNAREPRSCRSAATCAVACQIVADIV
jgi:hypothetical protein